MKTLHKVLWSIPGILVIAGAINWGLVGAFDYNVVTRLFSSTLVVKVLYILIGLSGIAAIPGIAKLFKK